MQPLTLSLIQTATHWHDPAANRAMFDDYTSYDQRHRFRMAGEHEHYGAGQRRCVVALGAWRILPLVCYDLRFPVWLRNRGDYDLLLAVANWPAPRQTAWNALLRARAIEYLAYAADVNVVGTDGNGVRYTGGSAVYGFELAPAQPGPRDLGRECEPKEDDG